MYLIPLNINLENNILLKYSTYKAYKQRERTAAAEALRALGTIQIFTSSKPCLNQQTQTLQNLKLLYLKSVP